ncbi:MAG: OmpA family protein, partial [Bacteroidota bacterium]
DFVLRGDTSFSIFTESIEKSKPLVFESLEFGANSYKLAGEVKPKLDYIVKFLQTYPMYKIVIEGHTDSDGEEAYNEDLSLQRARQIQAYITKEGDFSRSRVKAVGYGETRPLVPNDSEANKVRNRRVEFRLEYDPSYKGDAILPMKEELHFDEEFMDEEDDYDPTELLKEYDMFDETDDYWDELDEDDLDDLERELEKDMDEISLDDG